MFPILYLTLVHEDHVALFGVGRDGTGHRRVPVTVEHGLLTAEEPKSR